MAFQKLMGANHKENSIQASSSIPHRSLIRLRLLWCTTALLGVFVLGVPVLEAKEPQAAGDKISSLMARLGNNTAINRGALSQLRPLIKQYRSGVVHPGGAVHLEGVWHGRVEYLYVDEVDAQGNIVTGQVRTYLNIGQRRWQLHALDAQLEPLAAGTGTEITVRGFHTPGHIVVTDPNDHPRPIKSYKYR